MWLDLKDVIEIPGAEAPFACSLSTENLGFPSVVRFTSAPSASGAVRNNAGLLTLEGELKAAMICVCDRCGKAFEQKKTLKLHVPLAADMEDEDDPDVFPVRGNGVDLEEVLETCFILNMETKFLCKPDCKGLCGVCGKDLNDGPCSCSKPVDPRLAVLGQLLDIDDK